MTVVLGIDPGIATTGYGILRSDGSRYHYIDHGTIRTDSDTEMGKRLEKLYDRISEVVTTYKPDWAGIESLFFARNASSAFPVAQARGVILLALAQAGVPTEELSPQEIKRSITGVGRAEKTQVQELVRVLLGLKEIPKSDHAADALAAAICCYNKQSANIQLSKGT